MSEKIEYEVRTMSLMVKQFDQPIFSEMATTIWIVDEAAGEFVIVSQHGSPEMGKIAIEPQEWPMLRAAIDRLIAECRESK